MSTRPNIGQIGNATIIQQSVISAGSASVAAGFYAIAYNWNGTKIISYRGTNFDTSYPTGASVLDSPLVQDMFNGWTLGAGVNEASQAGLAISFYEDVTGGSIYDHTHGPQILVGHSLGGGLAGFVGSLSYSSAIGFDHMPYGLAALGQALSEAFARTLDQFGISTASLGEIIEKIVISAVNSPLFDAPEAPELTIDEFLQALGDHWSEVNPNTEALTGYFTTGEVLEYVRSGAVEFGIGSLLGGVLSAAGAPLLGTILEGYGIYLGFTTGALEAGVDKTEVDLYNTDLTDGGLLSPVDQAVAAHSISLLTTLLFGEKQWASEGGRTDWHDSAKYVLHWTSNDDLAKRAFGLLKDETGAATGGAQMSSMIAYSAIDEGERPFGDTGIRALFNDADDLGASIPNLPSVIDDTVRYQIGKLITEFSGLLAYEKVLNLNWPNAKGGILNVGNDGDVLYIDMTDTTWSLNGTLPNPHTIESAEDLVDGLVRAGSGLDQAEAVTVIASIDNWISSVSGGEYSGISEAVDTIAISLLNGQTFQATQSQKYQLVVGSDGAENVTIIGTPAIVVAAGGNNHIVGTSGNDALIGGDDGDILVGGDGNDWFFGGKGNNTIWGDQEVGGNSGHDTVKYLPHSGAEAVRYIGVAGSGPAYLNVSSNEFQDELHDVEEVYLGTGQSTLTITGHIDADTNLTIYNGDLGIQNLIARKFGNGIRAHIEKGQDDSTFGYIEDKATGGRIGIENFHTQIYGTDFDDDITDLSDEEKIVEAGDGNDVINVGDVSAIIFGGDGADKIIGGGGDDIIIDQSSARLDTAYFEQRSGYYIAGDISSGAGNDTIVVSTTDVPLAYEEITNPVTTDPAQPTIEASSHAGQYRFDINPGAGEDTVNLDLYHYSVRYRYENGDGDDIVYVKSSSNVAYSGDYSGEGYVQKGWVSQASISVSLYDVNISSMTFEYSSAQMVGEDIPNYDLSPDWLLHGDLVVTFLEGGSLTFKGIHVTTAGNAPGPDYNEPPAILSGPTGESFRAAIPYFDDSVAVTVVAASSPMRSGAGAENLLLGSEGGGEVTLTSGQHLYEGSLGETDRLIIGWDLDTLNVSYDNSTLTISDKWGVLDTTTATDFDEVYVVSEDRTYTPEDFADAMALRADSGDILGTSGVDTLTGTTARDRIFGRDGDDTLSGLSGDDYLDGGAGVDTMIGGDGDDTYIVDDEDDVVNEGSDAGDDLIKSYTNLILASDVESLELLGSATEGTGNALDNRLTGNNLDNILSGAGGNDVLYGNAGEDTLVGGDGDDRLVGGDGNDLLNGGGGNDLLIGGASIDIAHYSGSSTDYTITDPTDNLVSIVATGWGVTDGSDRLTGVEYAYFAGDDITLPIGYLTIQGTGDNDNLVGTVGRDIIRGLGGYDTLAGGVGNDRVYGGDGNDYLEGGDGNDYLEGGEGEDSLEGGVGADSMSGGLGNDFYDVDDTGDVVIEASDEGYDWIASTISFTLPVHVEDLQLIGSGDLDGTGNALDNVINGNDGNNVILGLDGDDDLFGGDGDDILVGGGGFNDLYGDDGFDTAVFARSSVDYLIYRIPNGTTWVEALDGTEGVATSNIEAFQFNGDNVTILASELPPLGTSGNDEIIGTARGDVLFGLAGNDTLVGGGGDDSFSGGVGADSMSGGLGNDSYDVDDVGDVVIEATDEGYDWIASTISFTLPMNVEDLQLFGSGDLNGNGNALNNVINGNDGSNVISGLDGDDYLSGGFGSDTLIGGNGADTFAFFFSDLGADVDEITTFEHGIDKIELFAFSVLDEDARGELDASRLVVGMAATTASHRLIYDDITGALSYDEDGVGGNAPIQFALLSNLPTIDASSFVLA